MLNFSCPQASISLLIRRAVVVKRVGILYHPMKKAAGNLARKLEGLLINHSVSAWRCSAWEGEEIKTRLDGTDLVLSIGGDGTILRAAQAVANTATPITGINLGRLGFMTELSAEEAVDKLPVLLTGEGQIDERAMLEARFDGSQQTFYALNDVVLARGAIARTISVEASIGDEQLTTYKADGVIVATATGSTGYSLAAGGPILHPQASEFTLLPIMPHLSLAYPLVLPPETVVRLRIVTTHKATLSIDGHINLPISSGTTIVVRISTQRARFLRVNPKAFYGSLEQKLKGKR
jgi:NAD+ kinase